MQLFLLIHRGPVVVDGWQRDAANDQEVDTSESAPKANPAQQPSADGPAENG